MTDWEFDENPQQVAVKVADDHDPFADDNSEQYREEAIKRLQSGHEKKSLGNFEKSLSQWAIHGDPEKVDTPMVPKRAKAINHKKRGMEWCVRNWPLCRVVDVEQNFQTRSGFFVKRDYLGFIDLNVHLIDGEMICVQVTSLKGKNSHLQKMSKIDACWEMVSAGKKVLLLCFDKGANGRFQAHEFYVTVDMLQACRDRAAKAVNRAPRKRKRNLWD
jgi:hypothetical protein